MKLLKRSFFERDPVVCARELLGVGFHHRNAGGVIVETEAYRSDDDAACHSFLRPRVRAWVDSVDAGTAYVYLNYGIYWLVNVVTKHRNGATGFVLIRALNPLWGIDAMMVRRKRTNVTELCSGPGKLSMALGIDSAFHGVNLLDGDGGPYFSLEDRLDDSRVAVGPRIGISKAKDLPWRFGVAGSPHLSRKFELR